ncbi:MAG: hypothetical protein KDC39_14665, partial [Actinobacteria bacterium]|nr:hypothetical protein [Actinomycetota bacterium]
VRLDMTDGADSFEISITDGQAIEATDEAAGLSLSLIRALAPQARVAGHGAASRLVLRWPVDD